MLPTRLAHKPKTWRRLWDILKASWTDAALGMVWAELLWSWDGELRAFSPAVMLILETKVMVCSRPCKHRSPYGDIQIGKGLVGRLHE